MLPAGADIVLEVHYHVTASRRRDKTEVGGLLRHRSDRTSGCDFCRSSILLLHPAGAPNHEVTPADARFNDITRAGRHAAHASDGHDMTRSATAAGDTVSRCRGAGLDFTGITYMYHGSAQLREGIKPEPDVSYDNSPAESKNSEHSRQSPR